MNVITVYIVPLMLLNIYLNVSLLLIKTKLSECILISKRYLIMSLEVFYIPYFIWIALGVIIIITYQYINIESLLISTFFLIID